MGVTVGELGGFLNQPMLLSLALSLITAQLLIGWLLWSLPTPFGARSKIRRFGRILIEDCFVNTFVLTIFSVPNLAIRLIGEFGWGSADAAYDNLYTFLGLSCCSIGNTSSACLSNFLGETINRQGMCGIPTGAGVLGAVLAGYRYAFWNIFAWLMALIAVSVLIMIIKSILPGVLQVIASFVGGIVQTFANSYVAMLMLLLIPIFLMVPVIIYLVYALYFFAKFIQVLWPAVLLIGGFLYGLPARLGRKWGAILISVTMVMYVGLPLLPAFVNTMASTEAAEANLANMQGDLNKVLSLVLKYGGTDVIFQVQPRQYGPAGDPYMAAPDYARIQITGGDARDRYIWTDRYGVRGYFLAPGTYTIQAVWWHGVPVTFNGTQTTFTITEDDLKASKDSIKHITLTADVYSFGFSANGNNGTVFFPVGFRLWGNTWYNARVYSMELTQRSVSFTFWSDCYIVSTYVFEMFVQSNVAYTDFLDGNPPGAGVKWEVKTPYYSASMWSDGALYKYYGIATGLTGGYHTFKVTVNDIGTAPATPKMEDEDQASLDVLQNPALPKPNQAWWSDLGQYYASMLILPNIFVYVILVGFAAGLARLLKGRTLI
jgi:hypothetical protein